MYIHKDELKYYKSDVLKDYKNMIKSKIIHTDHLTISNHINYIWKNPNEWWSSKIVQSQVNYFKKKYSMTVKNPVKQINNILNNLV